MIHFFVGCKVFTHIQLEVFNASDIIKFCSFTPRLSVILSFHYGMWTA